MKSGLSAAKYIRNNKRTCFVLIIALGLTFAAMYIINYLLMVTEESFKPIYLKLPKKVAYADLTPETLGVKTQDGNVEKAIPEAREELIRKLKSTDGVRDAYYTQVANANYNAVFGNTGYEFPLVDADKIPEFLEHVGAKLVEGNMPSGEGEILCDSIILKNQGLHVGDWFLENSYGKVFKVVGVIESDCMACVGMPNGFNNTGWYITVLVDEEHADFRKLAESLGYQISELDKVDDIVQYRKDKETDVDNVVRSVSDVILLVVMIFLAISVLVAYISFLRNRVNEYCLYASIGFSKREIYGMIMREMGIIFGTGLLLGAVSSMIGMALLDRLLINPQGLISAWWYPGQVGASLAAFAAIVDLLQIPILITVHSIRTVDLMED